jgi:hypothetical protein
MRNVDFNARTRRRKAATEKRFEQKGSEGNEEKIKTRLRK